MMDFDRYKELADLIPLLIKLSTLNPFKPEGHISRTNLHEELAETFEFFKAIMDRGESQRSDNACSQKLHILSGFIVNDIRSRGPMLRKRYNTLLCSCKMTTFYSWSRNVAVNFSQSDLHSLLQRQTSHSYLSIQLMQSTCNPETFVYASEIDLRWKDDLFDDSENSNVPVLQPTRLSP